MVRLFRINQQKLKTRLVVDRDKPRNFGLWFMVLGLFFDNVLLEHGELPYVLPLSVLVGFVVGAWPMRF